ncbi:MIP/aquaporin family protein [Alloiococcus sp. CFN-8]|uniref:MIP/aquaporin family protein n=1 Tax=Alloiococcus sp. CFN-8 TaxID=3416081 RepID=UPI003CECB0BC
MEQYIGEFFGTMLLILLGDGVVANVVLNKTKGNNAGWIVITTGWALAVAVPVFIFGPLTGAHFNPVVSIVAVISGGMEVGTAIGYIAVQMLGAIVGAVLVYLAYKPHFDETEDKGAKLGVFATAPGIRNTAFNFVGEFVGTFVLIFALQGIGNSSLTPEMTPVAVGMVIWVIGLCLGGNTGYAINPARDLGPRIAHFLLPIKGKGDSDWGYSWIPVIAPILGGICGYLVSTIAF